MGMGTANQLQHITIYIYQKCKDHLHPEEPGTGYQREDPSGEPSHPPSPADP